MKYDVDVVAVPAQAVLALGGRGPLAEMDRRSNRLRDLVAQAGLTPAGPLAARFYEAGDGGHEQEYDVCLPVEPLPDGSVPDAVGEARGAWVPQHHALHAVHVGSHDGMADAWRALREALDALGYTASGPLTEVYVKGRESTNDPSQYVTELRLPYAR